MSDHDIRTLLHGMADDVQDVRPLGRKALRRTRTRRWAMATTIVTSVVAIAAAGTGLALDAGPFGGSARIAPIGPGEPPQPMPGEVVAHGTSEDGTEWWLSAYENEAGMLCVDLQHEGTIAEDCGPYDPEGTGVGRHPNRDAPQSLFGWVPDDTAALWVSVDAGFYEDGGPEDESTEEEDSADADADTGSTTVEADESEGGTGSTSAESSAEDEAVEAEEEATEEEAVEEEPRRDDDVSIAYNMSPGVEFEGDTEAELFDAPEGFPFPVKFYAVVPAPADATAFRIQVQGGDATVLIFAQRSEASPPTFAGQLVADGSHGDYPWELYVRSPGEKRCIHLVWADERFGSSEGCSAAVPDEESFQFTMNRFDGEESSTIAFYAAVAHEVATLELELDGGETITVPTQKGPPGSEVDYGVAWLDPGSSGGWATSYDADGNVLDRLELCDLPDHSSGCASGSPSTHTAGEEG